MRLLLSKGKLRCSLCLLALLSLSLVDCLGYGLSSDSLPHLCSLALPGLDGTDKTGLRLSGGPVPAQCNEGAVGDTCHVLLFPSGQMGR
jgi:hypothetical protein